MAIVVYKQGNNGGDIGCLNDITTTEGAVHKVAQRIQNQSDKGEAETNENYMGDAVGAVGKILQETVTKNQHKRISYGASTASFVRGGTSWQQSEDRDAEFCLRNRGDAGGARQNMIYQDSVGGADMRLDEETEHTGEEGTGGLSLHLISYWYL